MHLGRQVLEKMGNYLQNGLGLDGVKIVQDENEGCSLPVDLVDEIFNRASNGSGCFSWSTPNKSGCMVGTIGCRAEMKYCR